MAMAKPPQLFQKIPHMQHALYADIVTLWINQGSDCIVCFSMETHSSARKAISEEDEQQPGVSTVVGAGASEAGEQQDGMASLPLGQIAALCQTSMAQLEDMAATTRTGEERVQSMALTKLMLDSPTFSDHDTGKSVTDFLDYLVLYRMVPGVSELDLLERVFPVALRGTAAQWLHLQPLFLSWEQFVAVFRSEFLPVDYDYHIRRELDARTHHADEGL
ncbi:hypothetical protein HPB49_018973 [Dermacentor silvarum]|uniref:Uncharacterized protein n=1 Tax=Dermacentor silvarum TaxID=543639 RepID=A0ACB8D7E5_DERSI|nr:hypothetical protein HPB49_018973 [Dermacentor silvarum]